MVIRKIIPIFRKQFEGGKRAVLDREIAQCMIFYDGMALQGGPTGRAVLDSLRAMPQRQAEDYILDVMKDEHV